MGMRILLWYAPKEIQCPTHGRVQEKISWAAAYARISYRLEWRLCALCQIMSQKAAAEILLLPTSTLSNLLPGKGRDTIDRFFNDCLSTGQKARILWASCDMSPAYTGAITHHCPNVTLVIDRFHV